MKKIFIISFMFIFVLLVNSFAVDDLSGDNGKKIKAMEFSIGFTQIHSFNYEKNINYVSGKYTQLHNVYYGQQFCFGLPISFIYYPNNYFGIGINNTLKFSIYLFQGFFLKYISITDGLKLVNKFGSLNSNSFFLLEYGLLLSGLLFQINSAADFFLGPNLFLGFEKKFNNAFLFTIGFNLDCLFNYSLENNTYLDDEYNYNFQLLNKLTIQLKPGIEMRFRFSYLKKWEKS